MSTKHRIQSIKNIFKEREKEIPMIESKATEIKICPQVTQSWAKHHALHTLCLYKEGQAISQ